MTRPMVFEPKGAREISGPPSAARRAAAATADAGAAKGMTFTVAIMRRRATGAKGAAVASVSDSSRRLMASTRAGSTRARPAASA